MPLWLTNHGPIWRAAGSISPRAVYNVVDGGKPSAQSPTSSGTQLSFSAARCTTSAPLVEHLPPPERHAVRRRVRPVDAHPEVVDGKRLIVSLYDELLQCSPARCQSRRRAERPLHPGRVARDSELRQALPALTPSKAGFSVVAGYAVP
jgi:hypothetical protein